MALDLLDRLLGKRLANYEAEHQHIGVLAGVPVLGLDALSSAAYGPEAALTLLIPLGAMGLGYITTISALIVGILVIVFLSYRQTIEAYPGGGGSYTVAKENLGNRAALLAGAALALDYVLNVAVGISAGVGALVSAIPALLPHTLILCLAILGFLTVINLRGIRESSVAFMAPTYLFVGTLGVIIFVGLVKTALAHGHPTPVVAPPLLAHPLETASLWLLVRAFASGCTAMTGVEAVSNGVPLFREPRARVAQTTLTLIVAILVALLLGIAWLSRIYGVGATDPGQVGYQSVLSILASAVIGRGVFYYVTIAAVVAVLALSANTSFADFPRLCRVLADDHYLPGMFAVRGRRLVFSHGVVMLAVFAAGLLILFGGITDRLIPLFAIGAFLAFTLSQAGMVVHWARAGGKHARRSLLVNAVGALATGVTLIVVAVSKFGDGAWITVLIVPLLMLLFYAVNRHYRSVALQIATIEPLAPPSQQMPVVVIAAASWNRMMQHGLTFALRLSTDVRVVQVKTERDAIEDLQDSWDLLIASPARTAGLAQPKLVVLTSEFRRFFGPFVDYCVALEKENEERDVIVVIPDLVMGHWYEGILHNNRGTFLRTVLRLRGGPRLFVVDAPYHLRS